MKKEELESINTTHNDAVARVDETKDTATSREEEITTEIANNDNDSNVIIIRRNVFSKILHKIQGKLSFEGWEPNEQFTAVDGLGRVSLLACILGILWGIHIMLAFLVLLYQHNIIIIINIDNDNNATSSSHFWKEIWNEDRIFMIFQWCIYVVLVCTFHLLEFFITAMYNPTVATADSYLGKYT